MESLAAGTRISPAGIVGLLLLLPLCLPAFGQEDDWPSWSPRRANSKSKQPRVAQQFDPFADPFAEPEPAPRPQRERLIQPFASPIPHRDGQPKQVPVADDGPSFGRGVSQPPRELPRQVQDGAQEPLCPDPSTLPGIEELTDDVAPDPGEFPRECPLGDKPFYGRQFACTKYTWKSSSLCHKPLYFEDIQLERYGNTRHWLFQPAISGTRFVASIITLPYQMGLAPPNECVYTLGYYRPGDCAPHLRYKIPFNLRAAAFQAAAVGGLIALVP